MLRSLYAPHFSFFGNQTSNNILFHSSTWNLKQSEYAYTTLIDTILDPVDRIDKFSSLSNGICITDYSSNSGVQYCQYIDSAYRDSIRQEQCLSKTLFNISAYPGARAFSILNIPSNKYLYETGYCKPFDYYAFQYKYLLYNHVMKQLGKANVSFVYKSVDLDTTTMPIITSLTDTQLEVVSLPLVQIKFYSCPMGFNLSREICDCIQILKHHEYKCDINYRNFTSPKGYWTSLGMTTGKIYDIILFDDYCPPNYCVEELEDFVLNSNLVDTSCVGNRSGVLCGECKDGYSVAFGSDHCYGHCTYLYLLTLPAYVLAGVILVFALFWLRLTVASGIINGVIFYANILGLVMNQMTGDYGWHPFKIVLDIISFIISILNLNLGVPLCFYEGMTSYFGENAGGTVISIVLSNLTVSGNLTIKDGYAVEGGGIHLDASSTLFLREPLDANFINNTADQESAIFAPIHDYGGDANRTLSVIQVLPIKPYSLINVTKIGIKLHFHNNQDGGVLRSLYAPHFSFFGIQASKNILFNSNTWNSKQSEYAYTTLIDTILDPVDRIDKFSSLANGICIYSSYFSEPDCQYIDSVYRNSTMQEWCHSKTLFYVSTYPGTRAFSILNIPSNKYLYETGYCQLFGNRNDRYLIYHLWKTQISNADMSFVYERMSLGTMTMPVITSLTDTVLETVPLPK